MTKEPIFGCKGWQQEKATIDGAYKKGLNAGKKESEARVAELEKKLADAEELLEFKDNALRAAIGQTKYNAMAELHTKMKEAANYSEQLSFDLEKSEARVQELKAENDSLKIQLQNALNACDELEGHGTPMKTRLK